MITGASEPVAEIPAHPDRRRGGTLVFGTSFAPNPEIWSMRHRRWLDGIRGSGLAYRQILLVDDGSPSLPDWADTTVVHDGVPVPRDEPVILYHFANRLGRPSRNDYPGWYRSFAFAARYAEEAGFDKVIHLESDAFLVSQRAVEYFNSARRGWIAMWVPRHDFAESAIQIIGADALDSFFSFCRTSYETFRGKDIERFLPLTKVEKSLRGDRHGEYLTYVPQDADYTVQVGTLPSYFWWLKRAMHPTLPEDRMAAYLKQLTPDQPLVHTGLSHLEFLPVLHKWFGAAHIPRGRNRDRPIPASRKMRPSLYRSKFQGNWERIFRAAAGFLLSDDVTRVFQTLRPAHILPGRDRHRISGWYASF